MSLEWLENKVGVPNCTSFPEIVYEIPSNVGTIFLLVRSLAAL